MPGSAAATSRSAADEGNAEIVRLPLAKGAHKSACCKVSTRQRSPKGDVTRTLQHSCNKRMQA
jgi:hypothetical protein